MKKKMYQLALVLFLSVTAMNSQATVTIDKDKVALMSKEEKIERINAIKLRVDEIKAMDKSTLNRVEKKALRHELRDMRKETKTLGSQGVYLSVGAILVIILLLILIL